MKVIDIVKNAQSTLFSFEILPPLKGRNINVLYQVIDPLIEFNPFAINITYHQEEIVFEKLENGLHKMRSVRKRPGTVAISGAIKNKYPSLEVVPHLICGGFSKEETEYALIDLNYLGIDNVLALRGDPIRSQKYFTPDANGHAHASELIEQIGKMNKGIFLDHEVASNSPTSFCIGAACYPEKHYESPNLDYDIQFIKKKIENGAEYLVTQMFFENQHYFDFVNACRAQGIEVPIIPGLKPLMSKKEINILAQTFHIDLPEALVKEVNKCKNDEEAWQVGVEWSIQQSKELKAAGVPVLHYYTISRSENIRQIAQQVF